MKQYINSLAIIVTAFYLNACGDDASSAAVAGTSTEVRTIIASCTVYESGESMYTIECPDGSNVTIHDGKNGSDGKDGVDGQDGSNGKDGIDGKEGSNGKDGIDGKDGSNGRDGIDGKDGADGQSDSVADTVSAKTSCTIKNNEDKSITIICPDGTSATVSSNAAVGGTSSGGSSSSSSGTQGINTTLVTWKTFDNTFTFPKTLYVYDYQKANSGLKDEVLVKFYSKTDTAGIVVKGSLSETVSSYYEANFYITPGKSHDNYVQASAGDTIFAVYLSGMHLKSDSLTRIWNPPTISKTATLHFGQKSYFGDSAEVLLSLTDPDLSNDSIYLPLYISGVKHSVTLLGGQGIYFAQVKLATANQDNATNTFIVKDSATIVVTYDDKSSNKVVTDTTRWKAKIKGSIVFSNDYTKFTGSTTQYIYLFDKDNTNLKPVVWVKNEDTGDSVSVNLSRNGEYYYGTFSMTQENTEGKLWVPDTTYITVSYYDESVQEYIIEQMLVHPYTNTASTESISLSFKQNAYEGITDKAALSFYESDRASQTLVSLKITSDSDTVGYMHEAEYYGSSLLSNATVGFTLGKSGNGLIHVAHGDTVRATYKSSSGRKYVAKTIWLAGLDLDTEDYTCNTESTALYTGKYNTLQKYVCQNGKFRKATESENQVDTACVKTNVGKVYKGNISDFACTENGFAVAYGTLEDTRDGRVYKTVRVGTQTWMAENLDYVDEANSYLQNRNWCYGNDPDNCAKYGRLYSWTAAMNISSTYESKSYSSSSTKPIQGICPTGSHLPTKVEWETLLGNASAANLRTTNWYYNSYYSANNSTGFSAMAGGYYTTSFREDTQFAYFWASSEYSSAYANSLSLSYANTSSVDRITKSYGLSIRCVLD